MHYEYTADGLDQVLKRFDDEQDFSESEFFAHQLQIALLKGLEDLTFQITEIRFSFQRLVEIESDRI